MAPTSTTNSYKHVDPPIPSTSRDSKRDQKCCIIKRCHPQRPSLHFRISPHPRITSVPSILPSHSQHQDSKHKKLSMDILLDAIDLDLQMRENFKAEWLKTQQSRYTNSATAVLIARRRSRSAPSAPPSHYFQQNRAFNSVWTAPSCNNRTVTSATDAQEVAQFIVKQHLKQSSIVQKSMNQ
ncbi:hypothetical protein BDF20DRAFT_837958 [Mycotypha africana]|uniref:uncharacterized protein n=1 Tax=Mycotypha africana TaxID=64632 RepID=UPI0023019A61|nr:uncharacterized protein BDF20DRAFT_837958 [Mycotypha africana]KAI8971658.1 hypothetical protein BDF20DRAFT_837958 [Mycotypha africana]